MDPLRAVDSTVMATSDDFDPASVRALRKRLGMTQPQLAAELGTTVNTVWRWEHGYQAVSKPYRRLLKMVLDRELSAA